MQAPEQQSCAVAQAAPAGPQAGAPHTPPTQPSEQHVPARRQGWPSDEHPAAFAQTSAPVPPGSGAQRKEQQSLPAAQA